MKTLKFYKKQYSILGNSLKRIYSEYKISQKRGIVSPKPMKPVHYSLIVKEFDCAMLIVRNKFQVPVRGIGLFTIQGDIIYRRVI